MLRRLYQPVIFLLVVGVFALVAHPAHARKLTKSEWRTLVKAQTFMEKAEPEKASELLEAMLQRKEPHSSTLSMAGLAFIQAGKENEALSVLKRGVELYPEHYVMHYNLALTAMRLESYSLARLHFLAAYDLRDKEKSGAELLYHAAAASYFNKEYVLALQYAKPLLKEPVVLSRWYRLVVNSYVMERQWKNADTICRIWLKKEPANKDGWRLLGQVLSQQEKYTEAVACFELATLLGKQVSQRSMFQMYRFMQANGEAARWAGKHKSWFEAAAALYRNAQFTSALEVLEREEGVEQDIHALLLKGQILAELGRNNEAVAAWKRIGAVELPEVSGKQLRKVRRERDRIYGYALFMAGSLHWLHKDWVAARNIFNKLELIPAYKHTGKSLARCMQGLLDSST